MRVLSRRHSNRSARAPAPNGDFVPAYIEYAYLTLIAYGVFLSGDYAGMMNLCLAAYCLKTLGRRIFESNSCGLACAVSFVVIQTVFHGEPITGGGVKSFVTWIIQLVILQSLALRPGFLHRYAIFATAIGIGLIPYISWEEAQDYSRASLDSSVLLANANDLSRWFGFLSVYFVTAGIEGNKSKAITICHWCLAVGALLVTGITVSRGAIIATLLGCIVAARRTLRRGMIPLFVLVAGIVVLYLSGLFQNTIDALIARIDQDTHRLPAWSIAIERILGSPFVGVGMSNIDIFLWDKGFSITPHNAFITLALAAGVVPLGFFLGYFAQAAKRALLASKRHIADAPFFLPLLVYVFVAIFPENGQFKLYWAMVTMSVIMAPNVIRTSAAHYRNMASRRSQDSTSRTLLPNKSMPASRPRLPFPSR